MIWGSECVCTDKNLLKVRLPVVVGGHLRALLRMGGMDATKRILLLDGEFSEDNQPMNSWTQELDRHNLQLSTWKSGAPETNYQLRHIKKKLTALSGWRNQSLWVAVKTLFHVGWKSPVFKFRSRIWLPESRFLGVIALWVGDLSIHLNAEKQVNREPDKKTMAILHEAYNGVPTVGIGTIVAAQLIPKELEIVTLKGSNTSGTGKNLRAPVNRPWKKSKLLLVVLAESMSNIKPDETISSSLRRKINATVAQEELQELEKTLLKLEHCARSTSFVVLVSIPNRKERHWLVHYLQLERELITDPTLLKPIRESDLWKVVDAWMWGYLMNKTEVGSCTQLCYEELMENIFRHLDGAWETTRQKAIRANVEKWNRLSLRLITSSFLPCVNAVFVEKETKLRFCCDFVKWKIWPPWKHEHYPARPVSAQPSILQVSTSHLLPVTCHWGARPTTDKNSLYR